MSINFNKNKKMHRDNNLSNKDPAKDKKDDGLDSTKGFWASDFNQRSSNKDHQGEEAKFKSDFSQNSGSKSVVQISEANGERVSTELSDSLRINILDDLELLERMKIARRPINKLKGIVQSKIIKLQVILEENRIINLDEEENNGTNDQNDIKYKVGDYIEVSEGKRKDLHKIISKNGSDYVLMNIKTGTNISKKSKSGVFSVPNPVIKNNEKVIYKSIKAKKVEGIKQDIVSILNCSTSKDCEKIDEKSALGRTLKLLKYTNKYINSKNLSSGEQFIFEDEKVNIGLFKMYFKLFYDEDILPLSVFLREINLILQDWNTIPDLSELREGQTVYTHVEELVSNTFTALQGLVTHPRYEGKYLEELFNELSGYIPPLKSTKFILDDFQKKVLKLINAHKAFLLDAPTSSGKSVIATFVQQHWQCGLIVIVVPDDSDVLAWQFSAKMQKDLDELHVSNVFVPIVTENYKSILSEYTEIEDEENIFDKLKSAKSIVGTAKEIAHILPEIDRDIGWLICDEIHTINRAEGKDMEIIIKLIGERNKNNLQSAEKKREIPIMGLSATIANPEFVKEWLENIGWSDVSIVSCKERFFNLQLHSTDNTGTVKDINPMSMVCIDDLTRSDSDNKAPIERDKEIDFTARDVLSLHKRMKEEFKTNNAEWNMDVRFNYIIQQNRDRTIESMDPNSNDYVPNKMFRLRDVKEYAEHLIMTLVNFANVKKTRQNVINLLNSFVPHNIQTHGNIDVFKLLKSEEAAKRTPGLIFNVNPSSCLLLAKDFYNKLKIMGSDTSDPDVAAKLSEIEEKYRETSVSRREKKKEEAEQTKDKKKEDAEKEKKKAKKECMKREKGPVKSSVNAPPKKKWRKELDLQIDYELFKPLEKHSFLPMVDKSQFDVDFKGYVESFNLMKIYKSNEHGIFWLIDLLQYGIGVYVKGLAGSYLRLVQKLALHKKLRFVFSDKSLMFGVSMPFRTALIFRDWYDNNQDYSIDPMMYQQMSGRAGRRGADIEGHILMVGFGFDRICQLSVKDIPKIEGNPRNFLKTSKSCEALSEGRHTARCINSNFIHQDSNDIADKFFDVMKSTDKRPELLIDDDNRRSSDLIDSERKRENKKFDRMLWRFRHDNESLIVPYIIDPMIRYFSQHDPSNEEDQKELGFFLCHFIHVLPRISEGSLDKIKSFPKVSKLICDPNNGIYKILEDNGISIDLNNIDDRVFKTISNNKLFTGTNDVIRIAQFKDEFREFARKVIEIQHYLYYVSEPWKRDMSESLYKANLTSYKKVATLAGKLVTRLWWEYQLDPILQNDIDETLDDSIVGDYSGDVTNVISVSSQEVNSEIDSDKWKNCITSDSDPKAVSKKSSITVIKSYPLKVKSINSALEGKGLRSRSIVGDGNCLFRAVSQDLYDTQDSHLDLRRRTVEYMRENGALFESFITHGDQNMDDYLEEISTDGAHADQYEISALQQVIQRPIFIFSNLHGSVSGTNLNYDGDVLENPIFLNYFDEIEDENEYSAGHYELLQGNVTQGIIDELKSSSCSESCVPSSTEEDAQKDDDVGIINDADISNLSNDELLRRLQLHMSKKKSSLKVDSSEESSKSKKKGSKNKQKKNSS